jgi:hypothetical protein
MEQLFLTRQKIHFFEVHISGKPDTLIPIIPAQEWHVP